MAWTSAQVAVAVLLFASIHMIRGILVDESDLTITEGSTRQVSFRRASSPSPLSLTVHVATIEGYKRHLQSSSLGCQLSLTSIGVDENSVDLDPAEDDDLSTREYQLQYAGGVPEATLTLEVVNDVIVENDETFILYTNLTESPDDRCAIFVTLHDNDLVRFNFSRESVDIGEGECLPCVLSIVKDGQNEPTLEVNRVDITVTSGNIDGTDYVPNADHVYNFTSDTTELPIATRLIGDRTAESLESFSICLDSTMLHRGARLANPHCVTINIFDDDSVLIGFTDTNTSLTLNEGGETQTLCIEIKHEGLPLDPHDIVILTMTATPEQLGGEIEFGPEPLIIDDTNQRTCRTVTAFDDNVSDGITSFMIAVAIDDPGSSTIPVLFSSNSIPVQIRDNDVTSFELNINGDVSGRNVISLMEGDSISTLLRITKTGYSSLTYRVHLLVRASNDVSDPSDLILDTNIQIESSNNAEDLINVPIQIPDDQLSEKKKEFSVTIASITAYQSNGSLAMGALTAIEGESIAITVYDNDINIGFTNETSVSVAEGGFGQVYVSILDIEPSDVNPVIAIPLQVSIGNMTSGFLHVSSSLITLSSTNFLDSFTVTFPIDNDVCDTNTRVFSLQLSHNARQNDQLSINFRRQSIIVNINDAEDCKSSVDAAAVAIPVLVIIVILIGGPIIAAVIYFWKKKGYRHYDAEENEMKYRGG